MIFPDFMSLWHFMPASLKFKFIFTALLFYKPDIFQGLLSRGNIPRDFGV